MSAAVAPQVERLRCVFDAQKAAAAGNPVPLLGERLDRLAQLGRMLIEQRQAFRAALAADFGSHHSPTGLSTTSTAPASTGGP